MSIQQQNHEPQTPDSFLLPPTVSDTENDVLNYNNLTTSPIVKVQPWIGVNSQSKLWLHCECTYADGRGGVIELAEAVPVGDATGGSTFSCELPLDVLAELGDNSNIAIILMVSNDGTLDKQSLSTIRYNLMFQHPTTLTNYSRWMTDIGTSLEHLKIRDLILPEAHNAGVDQKGAGWPADWWAACQDDSFTYQLNNGIRAIDLRLYRAGGDNRFEHNGYHASRYLRDLESAVLNFTEQNPGELVILDFHEVFLGSQEKHALDIMLLRIGNRCIPADAHNLTIKQIRSRYSGKNIVVAWTYSHPLCWRKVHQTWTGNSLNSAGGIAHHMDKIWSEPLPTGLWSMFACGYDGLSGPMRFDSSAVFWDRFFSRVGSDKYRQPTRGNLINIDFFAGTGAVDRCINATRNRAIKAAESVVEGFIISKTDHHNAQLMWKRSGEAGNLSGYTIFQNDTYLASLSSDAIGYPVTGLVDGRTYRFQIIAHFTDGDGATAEATISIPDITNPSRPYQLRIETWGPEHSLLVWARSTDNVALSHYEIYRNDEPSPIGTSSHAVFKIEEITNVTYVVRAVDTSNNYADSDPLIASGDFTPPSKPANLKASAKYDNTVILEWDPSNDNVALAGYQIHRNNKWIQMVDSNFFSETLSAGTYTYMVRAVDTSRNTTNSDELTFRLGAPLPSKPTQLRVTNLVGTVYITWNGSTDNIGLFYEIYRNGHLLAKVDHQPTQHGAQGFVTKNLVTPWSIVVRARNIGVDYVDSDPATSAIGVEST